MATILHLSDLHVRADSDHSHNRKLAKIVSWVTEHYAGVPLTIVITGDLVDDGEKEQYMQLVALLNPLKEAGFKLICAPGNHDCGRMGNAFMSSARVYFQQYVVARLMGIPDTDTASDVMDQVYPLIHVIDGVTYVGLDSVAGVVTDGPRFASGAIGRAQLAKLREILAVKSGQHPLVVYLHHHPFDRNFAMCLRDADELLAVLEGRYDLLLFGHKHRAEIWPSSAATLSADRVVVASGSTTEADHTGCCQLRQVSHAAGKFTAVQQRVRV